MARYGMVIGGLMMLAGLGVIVFEVFREGEQNITVLGFGIGLVMLGGVAALPATFTPILGAVLKKIPWGKGSDLTTPPAIVPPDEDPKP